jgi:hypothetical protein
LASYRGEVQQRREAGDDSFGARYATERLAAKRWPEDRDSRAKLVLRLLGESYRALGETAGKVAAERRETLRRTSGLLTGVYGPGYLEELRQEWPD